MERELVLAREIQQNFYPNIPETSNGVELCASSEMCAAVGGDYLGYFPLQGSRFLVLLGDVAGKGIGAALVMSSLHAACPALVRHVHGIEDVTGVLNETFAETTGAGVFVTMLIMLADPVARRVHYVRTGHNPPLFVANDGAARFFDGGGGPPIGLFSGLKFKREISNVEPGSVLVIYTDGVSEAHNSHDEQFGTDRLVQLVTAARESSGDRYPCVNSRLFKRLCRRRTHPRRQHPHRFEILVRSSACSLFSAGIYQPLFVLRPFRLALRARLRH
jgi:sigma-B regulation protein RsbU (phosphoserine phosphatase)